MGSLLRRRREGGAHVTFCGLGTEGGRLEQGEPVVLPGLEGMGLKKAHSPHLGQLNIKG